MAIIITIIIAIYIALDVCVCVCVFSFRLDDDSGGYDVYNIIYIYIIYIPPLVAIFLLRSATAITICSQFIKFG